MQINATLVKGKARVQFGANKVSEEAPECLISSWEIVNVELTLNDVMWTTMTVLRHRGCVPQLISVAW